MAAIGPEDVVEISTGGNKANRLFSLASKPRFVCLVPVPPDLCGWSLGLCGPEKCPYIGRAGNPFFRLVLLVFCP
jgi:hypothetical protein